MHDWKSVGALALLLALANCSSPARKPAHLTRVPALKNSAAPASVPTPARAAGNEGSITNAVPGDPFPRQDDPPLVSESVVPGRLILPHPPDNWIPLDAWSEANHFGPVQGLLSEGGPGFALHTPGGAITVMAGMQMAHVNGVNCWLGYAPRVVDGRLLVHALDALKNFVPLANQSGFRAAAGGVVVIDPGHGGENTGTRSVAGDHWEKEFTLDWARRLKPLLAGRGWKVVLTRTNDTDVSLSERVALADKVSADLFISLHFNFAARQDQAGLETYCLTPNGLPSTLTRDYEDDATRVYPNNTYDSQNLQIAVRLHGSLLEATGGVDRGVRRARFIVVLRGQNRPAVLLEGGYLSNPHESRAIAEPDYRQKLAEAVAKALSMNRPTPDPSLEGSRQSSAPREFPSQEGLGVGSWSRCMRKSERRLSMNLSATNPALTPHRRGPGRAVLLPAWERLGVGSWFLGSARTSWRLPTNRSQAVWIHASEEPNNPSDQSP